MTLRTKIERLFYRYGWDTRCRNLCPARALRTKLEGLMQGASPVLLDVGSGQLGLSAFLRGLPIVSSDLQPVHEGNGHLTFVRSTVIALPFRDRAFPVVSCIDVLEHLAPAQRADAITECLRVASHIALFAFPDGARARECDQAFQEACRARSRQVPAWVEEHLRYDYPVAEAVAEHIRQAAARLGQRAQVTESACEPLAICRAVRAAASRSVVFYVMCNLGFGIVAPLFRVSERREGYRAILLAELSPA